MSVLRKMFLGIVSCAVSLVLFPYAAISEENVLRIGSHSKADNLNPASVVGTWNYDVLGNILEGLVTNEADGQPVMGQAQSYTLSEDGRVYTFTLRDDALWSDGQPVVATDFTRAWQAAFSVEGGNPATYLMAGIKNAREVLDGEMPVDDLGIRALDAKTVEIELTEPQSYFLAILSQMSLAPVPFHVIDEFDPNEVWTSGKDLVFNGPYLMNGTTSDQPIVLTKNPHYHSADEVFFDRVEVVGTGGDDGQVIGQYLSGYLDILRLYASRQISLVASKAPEALFDEGDASMVYGVFNPSVEKLSDVNIRHALAMTAHQQTLANATTDNVVETENFIPPTVIGYPENAPVAYWTGWSLPQRLAEARKIMEGAGYSASNKLPVILKTTTHESLVGMGNALARIWSEIHVDVTVESNPAGQHFSPQHLTSGNFEVALATWVADYNDIHNFLNLLATDRYYNYGKWSNAEYDELIRRYEKETDPMLRSELVRRMFTLINEYSPVFPAVGRLTSTVVNPELDGYEQNAVTLHPFRYIRREN